MTDKLDELNQKAFSDLEKDCAKEMKKLISKNTTVEMVVDPCPGATTASNSGAAFHRAIKAKKGCYYDKNLILHRATSTYKISLNENNEIVDEDGKVIGKVEEYKKEVKRGKTSKGD